MKIDQGLLADGDKCRFGIPILTKCWDRSEADYTLSVIFDSLTCVSSVAKIMETRLPNLFILGAMKAGTTSLFQILHQQSEIYMAFVKEPLFFSRDDYYARGLDWYTDTFFSLAGAQRFRGEATPHYLYWAEKVAPRIFECMRNISPKFIIVFRDPVFRAYSHYWNMIDQGKETLSFKKALETETERLHINDRELRDAGSLLYGYKKGGMYASQLKTFLDYFPKQDFYFLLHEDLSTDNARLQAEICNFLGIPLSSVKKSIYHENPASAFRFPTLQKWLTNPSTVKDAIKFLIPFRTRYILKKRLLKNISRPISYPKLSSEMEAPLRDFFAQEVAELGEIIGRDLTRWLTGNDRAEDL
jgi:hypothetical protein